MIGGPCGVKIYVRILLLNRERKIENMRYGFTILSANNNVELRMPEFLK